MFLDHTQRPTTVGRTPLDEWSVRRRDLYLTTHDTHNRQTSMPPVGFEPKISAGERPETYALDRAANGTGIHNSLCTYNSEILFTSFRCGIYRFVFLYLSNSCHQIQQSEAYSLSCTRKWDERLPLQIKGPPSSDLYISIQATRHFLRLLVWQWANRVL